MTRMGSLRHYIAQPSFLLVAITEILNVDRQISSTRSTARFAEEARAKAIRAKSE